MIETLREVKTILDDLGINYWLETGTLLGAVRDGKALDWDSDIDFGMWHSDLKYITSASSEFKKRKFKLIIKGNDYCIMAKKKFPVDIALYRERDDYACTGWMMRKNAILSKLIEYHNVMNTILQTDRTIYVEPSRGLDREIVSFSSLLPSTFKKFQLKITWLILDRENCVIPVVIPKKYFENLSSIQFYGLFFNIPFDVENYLKCRYGSDWKIPNKNWTFWNDDKSIDLTWK